MTGDAPIYPKSENGKPVALEARETGEDGRRFSPSIQRNRDAVRDAFLDHMPRSGTLLEIASGTGEHGAHIAAACPDLTWIYSDIDETSLESQVAWKAAAGPDTHLEGPLHFDVRLEDWTAMGAPVPLDAIFCANMIHIAPFEAAEGLIAGTGRHLRPGGRLMLYGPFARNGEIAPSNADFSEQLKRRDPDWGVRDLDLDLVPLARAAGLKLVHVESMPANNLSALFEKA